MKKDIICIVCPKGCIIHVDYDENGINSMDGYSCKRGIDYAEAEIIAPKRMLTSSVLIEGAKYSVCPLKTGMPIPKDSIRCVMDSIKQMRISAPINRGDVIISNVCDTGVDVISTATMPEVER